MRHPIQPREVDAPRIDAPRIVAPRRGAVPLVRAQVREEIRNFLHALDSYPARVAKEPRVSFRQHLSGLFAASRDDRRDHRSRRQ